jgi:hypothetical protein
VDWQMRTRLDELDDRRTSTNCIDPIRAGTGHLIGKEIAIGLTCGVTRPSTPNEESPLNSAGFSCQTRRSDLATNPGNVVIPGSNA